MSESTMKIKKQTVKMFEDYFQATDEETKISLENDIIELNLNFALHKASQFRHTSLEEDDIITAAYTGLMFAVRTFDPSKAQFSTYANRVIENEINDALRRASRKKNNLASVSLDQEVNQEDPSSSLTRLDMLADKMDIEADFIKQSQFLMLLDVCQGILNEMEWTIINNSLKPREVRMTQYDMGILFSSSQTTISRMEKRAFKKVREFLDTQEWGGLDILR